MVYIIGNIIYLSRISFHCSNHIVKIRFKNKKDLHDKIKREIAIDKITGHYDKSVYCIYCELPIYKKLFQRRKVFEMKNEQSIFVLSLNIELKVMLETWLNKHENHL